MSVRSAIYLAFACAYLCIISYLILSHSVLCFDVWFTENYKKNVSDSVEEPNGAASLAIPASPAVDAEQKHLDHIAAQVRELHKTKEELTELRTQMRHAIHDQHMEGWAGALHVAMLAVVVVCTVALVAYLYYYQRNMSQCCRDFATGQTLPTKRQL